ncbi:MOSC domain-containing protein [Marinomonas shanghaiensis]|uniref:MOSC domain-containing protein n=1 Tax=Marinomonas shanghaiensis TaxID=2202418 RepID=UPI000DB99B56|nr:MOSC domain-containing protein [Marinomonas shanghaiensis]
MHHLQKDFFLYSVSELTIYPIKSIQGIALQSSLVNETGLWGDRRYTLVTPEGELITGRTHPQLTLVTAKKLTDSTWLLSHPNMPTSLTLDLTHFSQDYATITVWENTVNAQRTLEEADKWFSQVTEETTHLMYFGEQSKRFTKRRPEVSMGFADGYPFLLTTEASLSELNRTCPQRIQMAQFRPNIVIQGNSPFEEDSWKRIRIGSVEFENIKPCVRCIFTTLNPQTAERIPKGEPLKTLGKFRLLDGKGITFGANLIALNTGTIHIGDEVEILEYQEAQKYQDRRK